MYINIAPSRVAVSYPSVTVVKITYELQISWVFRMGIIRVWVQPVTSLFTIKNCSVLADVWGAVISLCVVLAL